MPSAERVSSRTDASHARMTMYCPKETAGESGDLLHHLTILFRQTSDYADRWWKAEGGKYLK